MPTIEAWYRDRAPYASAPTVTAIIFIPRLSRMGIVEFLIDTGADSTVLMPKDIKALGVDLGLLDDQKAVSSRGVGGTARSIPEEARIFFRGNSLLLWSDEIRFMDDRGENAPALGSLPSLLGRDFLNLCHMSADPLNDKFQMTPYRVDDQGRIVAPH